MLTATRETCHSLESTTATDSSDVSRAKNALFIHASLINQGHLSGFKVHQENISGIEFWLPMQSRVWTQSRRRFLGKELFWKLFINYLIYKFIELFNTTTYAKTNALQIFCFVFSNQFQKIMGQTDQEMCNISPCYCHVSKHAAGIFYIWSRY